MAVKTIYIARHGYRSNWLPHGPYPLPPTGVDSDVPLAQHGVDQAKELAYYLLSIENQPEVLFSSPFYRCIQTCEPISDLLSLPIHVDRGIGEWYKPDRPIIPEPADYDVMSQLFPGKISPKWKPTVIPSNKGETEEDIFARCKEFWPKFLEAVEREFPNVETIMLVTHAATKIALGMNLLKFKNCRESIDNSGTTIRSGSCSLDKYELVSNTRTRSDSESDSKTIPFENKKWKLTMNGNTEFLSQGEEMNWNFQRSFEAGSDADIKQMRELQESNKKLSNAPTTNSPEDETETVYVSLDIPSGSYREKNEVDATSTLQMSGLETETPLFKIGNKFYEGDWKKMVGTELAFPNAALKHKKTPFAESSSASSNDLDTTPTDMDKDRKSNSPDKIGNETAETKVKDDQNTDSESITEEKIYKISDRIILHEVKPM